MAHLIAINGSSQGTQYELEKSIIILGRHPDCDVVLDAGAVSRQHARIVRRGDELLLEDLKSRNGTFLNGRAIAEATGLSDGDLVRICDLEFSFHTNDAIALYDSTVIKDGSSTFGVMLIDDLDDSARAVSNKIDVRSGTAGSQLTTSAEVRLTAVLEIVQSLGKAVVVDDVLPKVLDTLFRIFVQADRGFIVLRDKNGALVPRWLKTRQADMQETFRISRTVMREVMDSRQALISLDASSDERFDSATSVADFRIRSMIVAPLLSSDGEAIGAIQMDTLNQRRRFEDSDLEILAAVAVQAGVAIENAQLNEQRVEQKLLEQDLDLAKRVQQAFLPSKHPDLPGFTFYHFYQPAQQIGGDYYDYIPLSDNRTAIVVADVVGHGVSAAMLMAKLSAETRYSLASTASVSQAISQLNTRISALGVEKFITFLCLVLDAKSGQIEIVNAGHMAPLWRRAGLIEQPGEAESGVPLGIMDDYEYEKSSITLQPGERLVLYTDGINEAPNAEGSLFGIPQIEKLLSAAKQDVADIGQNLTDTVLKFIQGTTQADDMCLLVIGRD
ncbi:MAG: SpoIIE family protein phosphatase [Pirellulaceae bacterium]|nr:SpoIIE family protein phosphatase [Pirellulaceae bacterium]